jgi:Ca-activated chloride channel family protein
MLIAFVLLPGLAHASDQSESTQAPYFSVNGGKPGVESLPLKETRADVKIAGVIAQVEVTQVYSNEGKKPIEAVYVFPTSTRAAVTGMKMKIGKRVIQAKIKSKKDAAKTYKRARKAGKTASLLEQERPNVFQMKVANIMPGDKVEVSLQYVESISPSKGVYEFVYPTVVGPRYTGEAAQEKWTNNPHTRAGEAPTYQWDITAQIQSGTPIRGLRSPSHKIATNFLSDKTVSIDVDDTRGGNRDFVLRYSLRGAAVETGVLLFPGAKEKFFLAMVQPPAKVTPEMLPAREYIFIVDVSGSMGGFPLRTTQTLVRKILKTLQPRDRVNFMTFAGGSAVLAPSSLSATPDNLAKVEVAINAMRGHGSTQILSALKEGLAMRRNEDLSTTFVVVTDGFVSVEREAFELISNNLGKANLFAFGIGSSVNRHLVEGMARAGMGEAFISVDRAEAARQASEFATLVSSPVLTDLKLQFRDFDAYDVVPKNLPDVFSDRPVLVYGKYRGGAKGSVSLSGTNGAGRIKRLVSIGSSGGASKSNKALRSLWARRRIQELNDLSVLGGPSLEPQLTKLGLKYGLMTAHTSFVAVDSRVRNVRGTSTTVRQTQPMPRGVPNAAIGCGNCGLAAGKGVVRHGAWGYGTIGAGSSFSSGLDDKDAYGGLLGSEVGSAGVGSASGGGGNATSSPPQVKIGSVSVTGSLDKNSLRRYIRRKIPAVRHCYERQLVKEPKLAGTIVVMLKINARGEVVSVASKGLGKSKLEGCVSKAMASIQFPQRTGGGVVFVRYPFRLRPAAPKR